MEGQYPYCPDGGYSTRNFCSDMFPCGAGEYCLRYMQNAFCCPGRSRWETAWEDHQGRCFAGSPSTQPKCPDGWPIRGYCTSGMCPQGTFCNENNFCCPRKNAAVFVNAVRCIVMHGQGVPCGGPGFDPHHS